MSNAKKVNGNSVSFNEKMLELTKKNLSKSRGINKKQILHNLILDNKMTRKEIEFGMTMKVLESEGFDTSTTEYSDDDIERFQKTYKTCTNSTYTFLSPNGKKVTYSGDDNYSEYTLNSDDNHFWITKN